MYVVNNIEKAFLKNNSNLKILKFIDRLFMILMLISLLLIFVFQIFSIKLSSIDIVFLIVIFIITFFIFTVSYILYDYDNIYSSKEKNEVSLFLKISRYICGYADRKSNSIVFLVKNLKQNNVKSKKDLELILKYFQAKKSISVKSNSAFEIVALAISFAAIFLSCYDAKRDIFNSYLFIMLIIGAALVILVLLSKWLFSLLKGCNDDFYETLEDQLIYVYLNFDFYFKSNGKFNIIEKINRWFSL